MQAFPIAIDMAPPSTPADGAQWSGPSAWRTVDDDVTLTFDDVESTAAPQMLRWRGSTWRVLGAARYWSTWHSLAVEPVGDPPPTCRGLRTSFWRFAAQTGPAGPILHFEVRGGGSTWRLVRLGVAVDLPTPR